VGGVTRPGDLIQITNVAHPDVEDRLRVGERHTVEYVGSTTSGTYVTLVGQPVALVESVGDRWTVLESAAS